MGVGRPSSRVREETAGSALHQCQGYPPELSPFLHRRESSDGRRLLPRYKRQRKQRSFFWSTTHDKECNYAASRTRSSQVSTFQASSRSSSARSFHRRRLGPARSVPSRPVVGPAALVPSIAAGSSVPRSQEGVYIIIARNS